MANTKQIFDVLKAEAERKHDTDFLAEVERRTGASVCHMLEWLKPKGFGDGYADRKQLADWLRRILGEKP